MLKASARNCRCSRSDKENFLASEKSNCVSPNPGISFRPSVPCWPAGAGLNAAGLRLCPPPADGFEIHFGWPGTKSGRIKVNPSTGEAAKLIALKGNPLLATPTASTDQSFTSAEAIRDFAKDGIS